MFVSCRQRVSLSLMVEDVADKSGMETSDTSSTRTTNSNFYPNTSPVTLNVVLLLYQDVALM
jgi:hypothetical protein